MMDSPDIMPQASLGGPDSSDGGAFGLFLGQVTKVYPRSPNMVDVSVPFAGNFRNVDVARPNLGKTRLNLCPLDEGDMVLVGFIGGLITNPVVLMCISPRGNAEIPKDRNVKAELFTAKNTDGTAAVEKRTVDGNANVTYELEGKGGNITIRLKGQVGNLNIELDSGSLNINVKGDAKITTKGSAEVKASGEVIVDGKNIKLGGAEAKILTEKTICPYIGLPHRAAPGQKTEA